MSTAILQAGHYGRTSGATGAFADGRHVERDLMILVARAARDLIDAVPGWSATIIPADADVSGSDPYRRYRGDAFVALHGDASGSARAAGGSVGYRTSDGRALAEAWKAAYRNEVGAHIGAWRGDNYTTGLSGYYGHRRAVAVGNTRAAVVEHGFLTNPAERRYLESAAGVAAAARACCVAVTGRLPNTNTNDEQDEPMDAKQYAALMDRIDAIPGKVTTDLLGHELKNHLNGKPWRVLDYWRLTARDTIRGYATVREVARELGDGVDLTPEAEARIDENVARALEEAHP